MEEQKWESKNDRLRDAGATLAMFKTMVGANGEGFPETTEKVNENIRR